MKPDLTGDFALKGNALYDMPAQILSMKHKSKQPRIALAQDGGKKKRKEKRAICENSSSTQLWKYV